MNCYYRQSSLLKKGIAITPVKHSPGLPPIMAQVCASFAEMYLKDMLLIPS